MANETAWKATGPDTWAYNGYTVTKKKTGHGVMFVPSYEGNGLLNPALATGFASLKIAQQFCERRYKRLTEETYEL